jgi:hypothetical protein
MQLVGAQGFDSLVDIGVKCLKWRKCATEVPFAHPNKTLGGGILVAYAIRTCNVSCEETSLKPSDP